MPETVERLRARFEPLFKGEFETGLYPDEWNWQEGRDRPDRTRQICNGWKSDRTVASVVLSEQVGRCVAELSGWPGARICQDNVIWKPAGAKALGYPPGRLLQRVVHALAHGDLLDRARRHQRGGRHHRICARLAQMGHLAADREVPRAGGLPEGVPRRGRARRHEGRHRADRGAGRRLRLPSRRHLARLRHEPRRPAAALGGGALHGSSDTQFHPTNVSYIYNRYKRHGDLAMDESFFPILWRKDGYRTRWLDRSFPPAMT